MGGSEKDEEPIGQSVQSREVTQPVVVVVVVVCLFSEPPPEGGLDLVTNRQGAI